MSLNRFNVLLSFEANNNVSNTQEPYSADAVKNALAEIACSHFDFECKQVGQTTNIKNAERIIIKVILPQTNNPVENLDNGSIIGYAATADKTLFFNKIVKNLKLLSGLTTSTLINVESVIEQALSVEPPGLVSGVVPSCPGKLKISLIRTTPTFEEYNVYMDGDTTAGTLSGVRLTITPFTQPVVGLTSKITSLLLGPISGLNTDNIGQLGDYKLESTIVATKPGGPNNTYTYKLVNNPYENTVKKNGVDISTLPGYSRSALGIVPPVGFMRVFAAVMVQGANSVERVFGQMAGTSGFEQKLQLTLNELRDDLTNVTDILFTPSADIDDNVGIAKIQVFRAALIEE